MYISYALNFAKKKEIMLLSKVSETKNFDNSSTNFMLISTWLQQSTAIGVNQCTWLNIKAEKRHLEKSFSVLRNEMTAVCLDDLRKLWGNAG